MDGMVYFMEIPSRNRWWLGVPPSTETSILSMFIPLLWVTFHALAGGTRDAGTLRGFGGDEGWVGLKVPHCSEVASQMCLFLFLWEEKYRGFLLKHLKLAPPRTGGRSGTEWSCEQLGSQSRGNSIGRSLDRPWGANASSRSWNPCSPRLKLLRRWLQHAPTHRLWSWTWLVSLNRIFYGFFQPKLWPFQFRQNEMIIGIAGTVSSFSDKAAKTQSGICSQENGRVLKTCSQSWAHANGLLQCLIFINLHNLLNICPILRN